MSDVKKSNKTPKAAPVETKAAEAKTEVPKTVEAKTEAPETKTAPKKQGMGEGQKVVTKAYKDNWNDIFRKKKKR